MYLNTIDYLKMVSFLDLFLYSDYTTVGYPYVPFRSIAIYLMHFDKYLYTLKKLYLPNLTQ